MKINTIAVFLFMIFLNWGCSSGGDQKDNQLVNKNSSSNSAFEGKNTTSVSGKENSSDQIDFSKYKISIRLTPYTPAYPDLGESGKNLLNSHINAAVSKIGFGGDGANPRFIIGVDINLLSKNVTSTAPTKYANTYEVTLKSCDVVTETNFSSYTFQVKGVGDSPDKSFINGFRDFKLENEAFFQFVKETEIKILAYYDKNCSSFISDAETQAKTRNFEAAFTILNNIPQESKECFEKVSLKKVEYFQMSLNAQCQSLLASMKTELGKANDPYSTGFNEPAMAYYQMIDRQSSCYPEAEKIYQTYLKKLNPKAKLDWEFKMRQYEDKIRKIESDDQFRRDSVEQNFSYLKNKDEMKAKAESEGNKKLLQKYEYDELPWIRKVFHLGKYDPFDRIEK